MPSTTSPAHPLAALWRRHRRHRPRLVAATVLSTLNTAADVAPELLIAAAVLDKNLRRDPG